MKKKCAPQTAVLSFALFSLLSCFKLTTEREVSAELEMDVQVLLCDFCLCTLILAGDSGRACPSPQNLQRSLQVFNLTSLGFPFFLGLRCRNIIVSFLIICIFCFHSDLHIEHKALLSIQAAPILLKNKR